MLSYNLIYNDFSGCFRPCHPSRPSISWLLQAAPPCHFRQLQPLPSNGNSAHLPHLLEKTHSGSPPQLFILSTKFFSQSFKFVFLCSKFTDVPWIGQIFWTDPGAKGFRSVLEFVQMKTALNSSPSPISQTERWKEEGWVVVGVGVHRGSHSCWILPELALDTTKSRMTVTERWRSLLLRLSLHLIRLSMTACASTESGFTSQLTQQLIQPATSCSQDSNSDQVKSPRENKKRGGEGGMCEVVSQAAIRFVSVGPPAGWRMSSGPLLSSLLPSTVPLPLRAQDSPHFTPQHTRTHTSVATLREKKEKKKESHPPSSSTHPGCQSAPTADPNKSEGSVHYNQPRFCPGGREREGRRKFHAYAPLTPHRRRVGRENQIYETLYLENHRDEFVLIPKEKRTRCCLLLYCW